MSDQAPVPGQVVIVGGGVAGLEALLALRALAGDRVALTLVSQNDWFVDRPVTVAEPFGFETGGAPFAAGDRRRVRRRIHARRRSPAWMPPAHRVDSADGQSLEFDTLILAPGAQTRPPF